MFNFNGESAAVAGSTVVVDTNFHSFSKAVYALLTSEKEVKDNTTGEFMWSYDESSEKITILTSNYTVQERELDLVIIKLFAIDRGYPSDVTSTQNKREWKKLLMNAFYQIDDKIKLNSESYASTEDAFELFRAVTYISIKKHKNTEDMVGIPLIGVNDLDFGSVSDVQLYESARENEIKQEIASIDRYNATQLKLDNRNIPRQLGLVVEDNQLSLVIEDVTLSNEFADFRNTLPEIKGLLGKSKVSYSDAWVKFVVVKKQEQTPGEKKVLKREYKKLLGDRTKDYKFVGGDFEEFKVWWKDQIDDYQAKERQKKQQPDIDVGDL